MNRERIQAAIELMKTAQNLNFAGYLALSPEWKEAGGSTTPDGKPVFKGDSGYLAVAAYFECRSDEELQFIKGMVYGDLCFQDSPGTPQRSNFYNKPWEEVTPQDVIEKLEQLLEMDQ